MKSRNGIVLLIAIGALGVHVRAAPMGFAPATNDQAFATTERSLAFQRTSRGNEDLIWATNTMVAGELAGEVTADTPELNLGWRVRCPRPRAGEGYCLQLQRQTNAPWNLVLHANGSVPQVTVTEIPGSVSRIRFRLQTAWRVNRAKVWPADRDESEAWQALALDHASSIPVGGNMAVSIWQGQGCFSRLDCRETEVFLQDVNLISNGSFEELNPYCPPAVDNERAKPFPYWDACGGWHDGIKVGTVAVDGNTSVMLRGSAWIATSSIPVRSGRTYRFSAWVRTAMPEMPVSVVEGDTLGNWRTLCGVVIKVTGEGCVLFCRPFSGRQDWRKTQVCFVVPPDVRYVNISVGFFNAQGNAWVDDMRLSELTAAATGAGE